ncbi:hypothetical protein FE848_13220 [Marinobacter sp. 1-3A]|uniref:hypothetical protein n=1 Tax=Marinobacter sp. 1-3A TaxID=2582920 RepID=UPI001907685D|nr:hypothetical protein [Marinobacter sp. 1-3A]MBK1874187.1 hypothetical protein [Marinobacter sp. 1-3A]
MFKKTLISLAVASSLGLTGCLSGGDEGANANPDYPISQDTFTTEFMAQFEGKTWPVFDPYPSASALPIPNDLIYDSEAGDGSFSVADSKPPVTTALNGLSGASTVAPIDIKFSGAISNVKGPSSNPAEAVQQNVFLIELDYASGDPLRGLSASELPSAGAPFNNFFVEPKDFNGESFLRITPVEPLKPNRRYVVILTNEIEDASGEPIVSSPAYTRLKDDTIVLGPSVDRVRSLINSFWEKVAEDALSTTIPAFGVSLNQARAANNLPELSRDNLALTYSFTTSNDKKVLQYIANPAQWIEDQLRLSVTTTAAKKARGAHFLLLNEAGVKSAPVMTAGTWDINKDGFVKKDDFQPFYDIYKAQMPAILGGFGSAEIVAAVNGALATFKPSSVDPDLGSCDETPFIVSPPPTYLAVDDKFECVGVLLKGGLAAKGLTFPEPKKSDIAIDFGTAKPAQAVSAILSSIPGSANVKVAQGTIKLPYYLEAPTSADGSPINTGFWKADTQLAAALNTAFKDAGLVIPQGAGKSEVLNANFPFPKKHADVEVPMLVMYPATVGGGTVVVDPTVEALNLPVVIFQHGITTDRSAALAFGSVLAAQGVAVIAIDQPLHGVGPFSNAEQEDLAETLLKAANKYSAENVTAVINGTFKYGAVLQIQQALDAAPTSTPPSLGISDPNNLDQLNGAIETVLSGVLDAQAPTAKPSLLAAISLESTVANAGSTIPGLAPTSTAQGIATNGATERHFGFGKNDFNQIIKMNFNADAAAGASGDLFINLTNFLGSRDNLRQGSVDLMTVRASIGDIAPAFDESNVYFVGHSLGTINGAAFVASTNAAAEGNAGRKDLKVKAANLLTPTGGVVRMLENSPAFGPTIIAGLTAQTGLTQNDSGLQTYFNVLQHAIDSVDPVNFTDDLQNVVFSQINNDNTTINDGMNNLDGIFPGKLGGQVIQVEMHSSMSPLSGSEPLDLLTGAQDVLSTATTPVTLPAFVRYNELAQHSTPVLPRARKDANGDDVAGSEAIAKATFGQMAAQTLSLVGTGGTAVVVDTGDATATPPRPDTSVSIVNPTPTP